MNIQFLAQCLVHSLGPKTSPFINAYIQYFYLLKEDNNTCFSETVAGKKEKKKKVESSWLKDTAFVSVDCYNK